MDLIGQYVALKKQGKDFVGLCPFHDDHRPSMSVSAAKQIFKCFMCGAGGGVFQFLMQYQKMTFPEAVRDLAGRANIPAPEEEFPAGGDTSLSSETLVKLMTFAARFFRDRLLGPEGEAALAYARGRQISEESIRRFGLGYAPESWDGLKSAARRGGFSERQLVATGLCIQRDEGGCYDRFRNRLTFPIINPAGKVIAFGGRALAADQPAKYLNSPETVLFDKSANLYAINWSRQAIIQAEQAVVVEGYLDALMPIQAGVENVVATLGTALTDRHVRMLARYAKEVVLVYDADAAGQAAAERAVELFLSQRVQVRIASVPVIDMPGGGQVKDPCDYVLAAGAEAFRQMLAAAPDALEFAWQRRSGRYRQAGSLAEKAAILEDFLKLIVSSAAYGAIDPIRQGLLVGHISELVGMSPQQVQDQMRRLARTVRRASAPSAPAAAAEEEPGAASYRAEAWLLGALLNAPELFGKVAEHVDPTMFAEPLLRAVAEELWRLGSQGQLELTALLNAGQSDQWSKVITDLLASGERRGKHEQTAAEVMQDFHRRRQNQELDQLRSAGPDDPDALLRKANENARGRIGQTDPRRKPPGYTDGAGSPRTG